MVRRFLIALGVMSVFAAEPALALDFSRFQVSPNAVTAPGFTREVIPLNGNPESARGKVQVIFALDTAADVQVKLQRDAEATRPPDAQEVRTFNDLPAGEETTFSFPATTQTFSNQTNVLSFHLRAAESTSAFPATSHTNVVVYVDAFDPNPPTSIRAEGADGILVVTWDAPRKIDRENFSQYILTYSTTDFSAMTTTQVENLPKKTASATGKEEEVISGLENGATYFVTGRTVDWVGNVSDFPRDSAGKITTATGIPVVTLTLAELAGEEGGCFIATAAYGSYQEKHVKLLRRFRDEALLRSSTGQAFVNWYYRTSPPYAKWIAEHDTARGAARLALWPLYALAHLVLNPVLGFGVAMVTLGFIGRRRLSAKASSKESS